MSITKAHCNNCGGERNHKVLHSEKTSWELEDAPVSGGDSYDTLMCCGCDRVHLRHTSWFSEDDEVKVTYFPPSIYRRPPDWFDELWLEFSDEAQLVESLLKEIYIATQNNLPRLAAMGVRALLEQIMIARSGDNGSFSDNLKAFTQMGYVTELQKQRLEAILEVGHAAIHRGYKPENASLLTLLDITEHIVASVYLHEGKIEQLRSQVPKRKPRRGS
jgi:hypothetical protein